MALEINIGDVGKAVTLSIYGNIDGVNTFNGTIVGYLTARGALGMVGNSSIVHNYMNIMPMLPAEVRARLGSDYRDVNYIMLLTVEGEVYFLAEPWVIESSFLLITNPVRIKVGDYANIDMDNVRNYLSAYEITIVDETDYVELDLFAQTTELTAMTAEQIYASAKHTLEANGFSVIN